MSRAAIRYGKAILDTAHDKGVATEVNNDMSDIAASIAGSTELNDFLVSPTTTSEMKENALLEIFSGVNGVTKGLFKLLFENKRFEILADIAKEYNRMFEEMNGVEHATVTTAIEMDAALEAKVMSKILEFSNKKIVIENIVDPAIIGGFVLRIGDKQYNASIADKLLGLKREMSN
jgi:F-type H+-transporting ATPase subunit delta